jgi:hypothetical protein
VETHRYHLEGSDLGNGEKLPLAQKLPLSQLAKFTNNPKGSNYFQKKK